MEHILCAVDLSDEPDALKILEEAEKLAGLYDASLSLVTVVPDYGSSWVGSFFKEGTLKMATEAAMDALKKLSADTQARGRKVQHIVEIGTTYEEILHAADQMNADLIVVGAHKPDLASRIIGPNASRVVRYAKASVLVVRV
ncbi:universal stress protein [Yoonia sp. I 8.24]|uniref:universal stress protein n=1 Tax=Yoonia sp. I 8.24 TaxID=1537229 RepID=UPI001EDF2D79|nr:universal stress protein [Yoonia sp. I 8.24]MCG3269605.1 universal stress protein [Yoonia sp. I 8.24]